MKQFVKSVTVYSILIFLILIPILFSKSFGYETTTAKPITLTILYDNDLHGRLLPFDDSRAGKNIGGAARRSYLISQIKKENPNTIAITAGDWVSGTPISGIFQGEVDFNTFQKMPYDAFIMGNHEFDFGQDRIRNFINTSKIPVLAANIFESDGTTLFAKPYIIKEIGGLKVAILGLITYDTPITTHPRNIVGLNFENPVTVAQKYIPKLRQKADIIIVGTHIGLMEDINLANRVNGIDVIIGGHSHTKIEGLIQFRRTAIVQAHQWGIYLGRLDLTIENKRIQDAQATLIPITSALAEDKKLAAYLQPYAEEVAQRMKAVIGKTEVELIRPSFTNPETNLANWLTDIFRKRTNADIAFQNTGGIRASIDKGDITLNELYSVLPFDNTLVLLEVNGLELKAIMDDLANKIQNAVEPSSVSGVTFQIKDGIAHDIKIGGKPLDMTKKYTLAVNDFMAAGGSGYHLLKEVKVLRYDDLLRDIVIDYLHENPVVAPELEKRILL